MIYLKERVDKLYLKVDDSLVWNVDDMVFLKKLLRRVELLRSTIPQVIIDFCSVPTNDVKLLKSLTCRETDDSREENRQ